MTHLTCRLTAKLRDELRNPTLGNRLWATFYCGKLTVIPQTCWLNVKGKERAVGKGMGETWVGQ